MVDVVIVEDNAPEAQVLYNQLRAFPQGDAFAITRLDGAAALRDHLAARRAPDILLMDITLGEEANGIELVRELIQPNGLTQVIYVTGYLEYCVQAYRTDHVYYLVKPVDQADLDDALARALANLEKRRRHVLAVRNGARVIGVPAHQIRFIESNLRKVTVHYDGVSLETYATIRDLIQKLPDCFVQCHKSFLVNMAYIAELGEEDVLLTSGEKLPLVKRRRTAVRDAFVAYLQGGC